MHSSRARRAALMASLLLPACVAVAAPARGEDWPRFRGANGAGVVAGRFAGTVSAKDVAWTADLPGKGHGSPVVWKGRVYLTSADPEEGKRYVVCLSAADGSVVWRKEYDFAKYRQHADNSYSSASPAVDDAGVYVAWSTPAHYTAFALGHDGAERWSHDLGGFQSVQGQGASPVVVGDAVVVANDQEGPKSSLVAFDRRTGAALWTVERKSCDKASMSTPVVYRPPGGGGPQVVFTSKAAGMTAVDAATGQVAWEVSDAFNARTVGSPVLAGDLIVGACGEGGAQRDLAAVRPPAAPGAEAKIEYAVKRVAPYVPTPLVVGPRAYLWGDAGVLTCVDAATGAEAWSRKVGGMYYGSPVCVGDTLWCLSRKGDLIGASATDKDAPLAKLSLGDPSHATPAVADGKMYLRTVSKLTCVTLRPG
ncbi:MAG: hypothetical protein JWO31_3242 [Phycisphaerales bacterium]|nr:hypothetical protein [Phycisphaerales bacterium]